MDLIIYINLDKRPDRRKEIEAEFRRLGIPESKILRWPAVYIEGKGPRGGSMGCTMSHVGALSYVENLPDDIQTVLILEDDFNFHPDAELVKTSLAKWLQYPRDLWDVVLLSYHVIYHEPYDDLVSRAFYSHGTAGYLVNRRGLPNLLRVLRESQDGLVRTGEEQYVIDVYWHHFMKGGKCFYFNVPLGYQRESYSDIQQQVMMNPSHVG